MSGLIPKFSAATAFVVVLSISVVGSALAGPIGVAEPASAASVHLLSCTGAKLTRPSGDVTLACADDGVAIRDTVWSSWTATSAAGVTELEINLCQPTCVASRTISLRHSKVRLYDVVKTTAHGVVFGRAAITYTRSGKQTTVIAYPLS